jgi:hypothetical protein
MGLAMAGLLPEANVAWSIVNGFHVGSSESSSDRRKDGKRRKNLA